MTVAIAFENVSKKYHLTEQPAVRNLNLNVLQGSIVVLVGPSGCGKTTTMKMINRLIEPTEGKILLNGEDISTYNPLELRRNIGYVIQHTGLFPHMTIEQNISIVPKLKKWPNDAINKRVTELLELVGLDPETMRKKLPNQLSGGQQQRIGVARALAGDPPVMLMDEPFGALDPISRGNLQKEFLKIQQQVRKTIIFVTHDIDEAVRMGDRIVLMRGGEVIQDDTPEVILKSPANQFIANLTGDDRLIKYLSLVSVGRLIQNTNDKHVEEGERGLGEAIDTNSSLKDALVCMLERGVTNLAVRNPQGKILGEIKLNSLVEVVVNGRIRMENGENLQIGR